jgi:hypothetical protein
LNDVTATWYSSEWGRKSICARWICWARKNDSESSLPLWFVDFSSSSRPRDCENRSEAILGISERPQFPLCHSPRMTSLCYCRFDFDRLNFLLTSSFFSRAKSSNLLFAFFARIALTQSISPMWQSFILVSR